MSENEPQVLRFGPHSFTVPPGTEVKLGMEFTEEQAVAIARAAGAAPAAAPTLADRIAATRQALTPATAAEVLRQQAKELEGKMQASRRHLGLPPSTASTADRVAEAKNALGL